MTGKNNFWLYIFKAYGAQKIYNQKKLLHARPNRNQTHSSKMAEEEEQYIAEESEDILIDTAAEQEAAKNDPLALLLAHHPEHVIAYAETIAPKLQLVASPPMGKDPNHKSVPFLTTYERTKVIGFRANQLSKGAKPYIKVPPYVRDVSEISRMELKERRLPFIIRRPMPDGTHEYWRLSDLLII
jgi:DNA-directed RNA polymerase subunit K/omega